MNFVPSSVNRLLDEDWCAACQEYRARRAEGFLCPICKDKGVKVGLYKTGYK